MTLSWTYVVPAHDRHTADRVQHALGKTKPLSYRANTEVRLRDRVGQFRREAVKVPRDSSAAKTAWSFQGRSGSARCYCRSRRGCVRTSSDSQVFGCCLRPKQCIGMACSGLGVSTFIFERLDRSNSARSLASSGFRIVLGRRILTV